MPGAATPVSLPISTVAAKQLPDVTMVRLHNVPGGINVHGLMACLLKHFQFGPEYSVVSEYASEGPIWRCEAAEDGVSRRSLQRSAKTCFFRGYSSSSASSRNTFHTIDNVVWGWPVPCESSLELQEPLWQQCTTPKEAWLQALQETLHHVRPTRSC